MEPTALVALLQTAVPDAGLEVAPTSDIHPTFYVPRDQILTVLRQFRDRPDLKFALLSEMTAVDLWPHEPRFEIILILVSIEHRLRVRLKLRLQGDDARMPTLTGLWPSANWLEREIWDMFGIVFDGHPDPRRLLMPEDWEGYPLRKDYPVQIQMRPHTTQAMQVTEAEFRQNLLNDRLTRS
jgi:NADH-quinone oxidoreductase subunit C